MYVCMHVCMYVFMYVCMYEETEMTWPGEEPNPMQLHVAQGAAPYSYTARRGADWIGGRCGAGAHRYAELLVGRHRVKGVAPARARPFRPWVEFVVERSPREACAEIGVGTACEVDHRCHRWSSLRGRIRVRAVPKYAEGRHATPSFGLRRWSSPWGLLSAQMGGETPWEPSLWGRRWKGCADMGGMAR